MDFSVRDPGRWAVRRRLIGGLIVAFWVVIAPATSAARGWSIQPTPNPAGANLSILYRVSCSSRNACTAVGYDVTPGALFRTLVERWNGSAWRIQPTPVPAGQTGGTLTSVSCPRRRACVAVGATGNSPLVGRWNGSTWTMESAPLPSGAHLGYFEGVSCTTPRACTAVGSYFTSTNTYFTLAERWDGSSWRIQPTPTPPLSLANQFDDVSCPGARTCTAVGFPASAQWNGTTWTPAAIVTPGGTLQGVSCTSPRACTAVGSNYAERWDGSTWQLQTLPTSAPTTELVNVSCTTPLGCTAVGSYSTDTNGIVFSTIAEHWNGVRWSIQVTPNPTGGGIFGGVSCTRSGVCIAVGETMTGSQRTLAERYSP